MAKKYENFEDNQLLMRLISEGRNDDEVKSLLTRELALAHFEGLGSLLHYAIMCDNEVIARELIDLGSDVNRFGAGDKTPLGLALSIPKGAKFADMLLDANADIHITDNKVTSALTLIFASTYPIDNVRNIEVILRRIRADFSSVEEFLDHLSTNNSGFSFYHAACLRDVKVLECLLNRGFNIDQRGPEVRTALFAAAELGDAALIKWLINNGANINATDARGNTALVECVRWAKKKMLELLLELGANPNIRCRYSALFTTVSMMSNARRPEARQSYPECIETLLFYGSRIPQYDDHLNYNFFDVAFQCDNHSLVYYFVAHLAMTDKLGISDRESTLRCSRVENIMKLPQLEAYYESCRKLLDLRVRRSLSLFDLLTGSNAKMRIHARNETLCQEIDQICAGLSESCPYYAKRMNKRISKAVDWLKLEKAAIEVLHELFGSNDSQCPDFGRKVAAYLSDNDLEQLRQV